MCYIFIFVYFPFENKKMTDDVNHEITSEYVDESLSYLLLLPVCSEMVLSGFQGESVHCNVKSNKTLYLDFLEERQFV